MNKKHMLKFKTETKKYNVSYPTFFWHPFHSLVLTLTALYCEGPGPKRYETSDSEPSEAGTDYASSGEGQLGGNRRPV